MMGLGALFGALSSVAGLYLSYYVSVASGAAIVLVCTALFGVVLLFGPGRGLVWGWVRRLRG
jgi:ABC-type Mn2+/Zn2+ transport system permease subunit